MVEFSLILVNPLLGHMVWRMGRAGGEIDEERLVRHDGLLGPDPSDGVVGQVLSKVIAFLRRLGRLDRRGTFLQRGIPLVVLAADEPIEILEA